MIFHPGKIVRDMDCESMFHEKQGLVVGVQYRFWEEPEIFVLFDRCLYPYYLREDECVHGLVVVCPACDLRVCEDWDAPVYARRVFGSRFFRVQRVVGGVYRESACMVDGCEGVQEKQIWFNIWGTVCNAYVCSSCAAIYHRCYMDSFPWRMLAAAA